MLVAYWVVAGLLALVYLAAGGSKLFQSTDKLASSLPWTQDFSRGAVRTIGALEVLGAVGLVLPPLTGILALLAPIAAIGLVAVQIGAIVVHTRRGETKALPVNVILALLAAVVVVLGFLVWA